MSRRNFDRDFKLSAVKMAESSDLPLLVTVAGMILSTQTILLTVSVSHD